MRDILLFAAVAAAFVFGYFVVRKLGCFLDGQQQKPQHAAEADRLRIGVTDPMVAAGLSDELDRYSAAHPGTHVSLLSGTEEELMRALSAHRLDMAFVPETSEMPGRACTLVREIKPCRDAGPEDRESLPLTPLAQGEAQQKIIWLERELTPAADSFLELLRINSASPVQKA